MTGKTQNENAVVFVCDQNFVRFALFEIWQIAHHNPIRDFDFVIYSPDEITLPEWAKVWDVKTVRAGPVGEVPKAAMWSGTAITYFRFAMVRELGHLYRRIIQMDCDMFIEGGDFNRLFRADMGSHAVGAALDYKHFVHGKNHAEDFRRAGLPSANYLNAGFQLIDTAAYREQDIEKRANAAYRDYPGAIRTGDQSALNFVLKGKFAELSPAWNWHRNVALPLVTLRFPVFVRHFITRTKPDLAAGRVHDPRFNLAYREFFGRLDPEYLAKIAPPCNPSPMSLRDAARIVWGHVKALHLSRDIIARHPDPYKPKL